MEDYVPLEPGYFYHIYNRGINGCDLFLEEKNKEFFFNLYEKYVAPAISTYAWALMKNHIHFLLYIKDDFDPNNEKPSKSVHQLFSNLFNAYSKSFNNEYNRHGGLFERPFKRICITEQSYLKQALVYINNNPVHHGICKTAVDYEWSSYRQYISGNPPALFQNVILEWFESIENFKLAHEKTVIII